MSDKDYYTILEVTRNSTDEEIKASFKRLAKKYHPDINKEPGASDQLRLVIEANDWLKANHKDSPKSYYKPSSNVEARVDIYRIFRKKKWCFLYYHDRTMDIRLV